MPLGWAYNVFIDASLHPQYQDPRVADAWETMVLNIVIDILKNRVGREMLLSIEDSGHTLFIEPHKTLPALANSPDADHAKLKLKGTCSAGGDTTIQFDPMQFTSEPDSALVHEMMHAVRGMTGLTCDHHAKRLASNHPGCQFENRKELYAILIENMYRAAGGAETVQQLRWTHFTNPTAVVGQPNGCNAMPLPLDPDDFAGEFDIEIAGLVAHMHKLFMRLSFLPVQPVWWNPLRSHRVKTKEAPPQPKILASFSPPACHDQILGRQVDSFDRQIAAATMHPTLRRHRK